VNVFETVVTLKTASSRPKRHFLEAHLYISGHVVLLGLLKISSKFPYSIIPIFNHSIMQSFNHSYIHSFNHSIIHSFIHSIIQIIHIIILINATTSARTFNVLETPSVTSQAPSYPQYSHRHIPPYP
jgi:hypothetical protein